MIMTQHGTACTVLLPLDVPHGEARTHKVEGEERPERLLPAKEGETQVRHLVIGLHNA